MIAYPLDAKAAGLYILRVVTVVVKFAAWVDDICNSLLTRELRRPSSMVERSFRKAEVQGSTPWVGLVT